MFLAPDDGVRRLLFGRRQKLKGEPETTVDSAKKDCEAIGRVLATEEVERRILYGAPLAKAWEGGS